MVGEVGAASALLLLFLLLLSAFFSGAEAALLSVQRVRIQHLVNTKVPGAARVAHLIATPARLLPPILLGNNLVNTAAAAVATAVALTIFEDEGRAVLAATVAVTIALLVFGETIPKTVAARHADRASIIVAIPIQWVSWVLRPASFVLEAISGAVASLLGKGDSSSITEEEIRTMIQVGRDAGAVEHGEAEMIRRVLEFGDRHVREVMTPRTEIVWVELGTDIKDFLALYNENYHTRFPVFQGTTDNVVGMVAVKDVMRLLAAGAAPEASATVHVRPAMFVPETKRVQDLFDEMRTSGEQMAMIADEFGGVAGLVTLKRLVEDIVGRVGEEDYGITEAVQEVGEDAFEVEGNLTIAEVNERLGAEIPTGEYDTVAGFVLEQLGSVPEEGAMLSYEHLHLQVLEMRGVRIGKVRIVREPPPEE